MARNFKSWLTAYVDLASCSEAPKMMHFWAGVSAIAGALRRRVWFDQVRFTWYPSFFIIFVGPPAVITKSTTADGAISILKEVPGIKFGPDSVTWQKMCETLANSCESFEYKDEWRPMSAVTFSAGELGSLVDFEDDGMVNFLIELWDGKKSYEKQTKTSGDDKIEEPWVNIIGCTMPQWIAANLNSTTMGGGFTSRCIFVYGDKKERPVAYLKKMVNGNYNGIRQLLVQDLEHIATNLCGEYVLTSEAEAWGEPWYSRLWDVEYKADNPAWLNGYIGRKQAHLHKLAMIIAASQRDELVIELEDLQLANIMLEQLEPSMEKTFSLAGKSEDGANMDKFLEVLRARKEMPFADAYRILQIYFPDARRIDGALLAVQRAGRITMNVAKQPVVLRYVGD